MTAGTPSAVVTNATREAPRRVIEPMAGVAVLARELGGATSVDEAQRAAIRFCQRGFDVQGAVFIRDGASLRLAGTWGLTPSQFRTVRSLTSTGARDLRSLERGFASATSLRHVRIVHAGQALVVIGDIPTAYRPVLDAVAAMLADTLARLQREERREQDLDLGLAMTAHELRGPLLGARVALEQLASGDGRRAGDVRLLQRTERELARLADKVEGLLHWAVGDGALHRTKTDLVQLTREAIESCTLEFDKRRIVLRAPARLPVEADRTHLRGAVENVIRNALEYSPHDDMVDVRVYRTAAGMATVTVRDRGPGIEPADAAHLFDPFAPRDPRTSRCDGHGLGLFIAKRVLDAHGGDIAWWPARDGIGTVFRLRLAGVA